jgi:two-component system chemotaxis response regulator CheB
MSKIRVLVVDDAVVVRKLVTDVLSADPELTVAGTAPNGRIALAKLEQLAPDIVLMDIEMPEMNGLEALAALRKTHPRLPVIMFSTLTQRGGAATLEALALGATDYVTKPANVGSVTEALERVRTEMIPKIKQLCRRTLFAGSPPPAPARIRPTTMVPGRDGRRVDLLVIGVSTGGPNALAALLPDLPATLPVPVLIVQHMPPLFTKLLADRLDARCPLQVREASAGDAVAPGMVYLAPGDYHMAVQPSGVSMRLRLHQGPPENFCRPAVDVLFRSAAEAYRGGVLGVVLTGMGQDGLRGSEAVRDAGGQILAQDEATSVVWGMPGFVARTGLADRVLPLDQIAPELVRRCMAGRTLAQTR